MLRGQSVRAARRLGREQQRAVAVARGNQAEIADEGGDALAIARCHQLHDRVPARSPVAQNERAGWRPARSAATAAASPPHRPRRRSCRSNAEARRVSHATSPRRTDRDLPGRAGATANGTASNTGRSSWRSTSRTLTKTWRVAFSSAKTAAAARTAQHEPAELTGARRVAARQRRVRRLHHPHVGPARTLQRAGQLRLLAASGDRAVALVKHVARALQIAVLAGQAGQFVLRACSRTPSASSCAFLACKPCNCATA